MRNIVRIALAGLLTLSFAAHAELFIQSAQYKPEKGVLFVKGKVDKATGVHVFGRSRRPVATLEVKGKQFRADIEIAESLVPCMVRIRSLDAKEMSVAPVRHAPNCSQ